MSASIHPSNWDWLAISALATIALALGTFWMAWMTRRLAKQAIAEVSDANKLAKAAEDQRDIAARNEYAQHQPVFIPIFPRQRPDERTTSFNMGGRIVLHDVEASFVDTSPANTVSVRLVLRNVGRGAGRIIEDTDTNLVDVAIGAGMTSSGSPTPVVVAPGDTVEIWAVGKPRMSPQLVPTNTIRGIEPYVRIRFQYTDLTNTMTTDSDILYEQYSENELRPVDVQLSQPRPALAETKVDQT